MFRLQSNARRITIVKTCINVIMIMLFSLFYTYCTWFGKNELGLYLKKSKIMHNAFSYKIRKCIIEYSIITV